MAYIKLPTTLRYGILIIFCFSYGVKELALRYLPFATGISLGLHVLMLNHLRTFLI